MQQGVLLLVVPGIDVGLGRHDVVVAGENDRHAGRHQLRGMGDQALEPGELVVELGPGPGIAVGQVQRGDQERRRPPPRCSGPACRRDRRAARGGSGRGWRRGPGWRRRSSSSGPATRRRSRQPRAPRAGSALWSAFSSCRQTTSGRSASSHRSRLGSRVLTPLTLKVAILIAGGPSPDRASRSPRPGIARRRRSPSRP